MKNFFKKLIGLVLVVGVLCNLNMINISADDVEISDKCQSVINSINLLPDNITIKNQYDIESIWWAYNELSEKNKSYIDKDTIQKLENANKIIEGIITSYKSIPVSSNTTLNWSQFLGNPNLPGISDSKTPINQS